MIAATVALAVGLTSMLPTTSGPMASLAVLPPVDEDASMYDCKVETSVSKEFSTGDWGTLTGDWYAIVENVDFEVECLRARFESDDESLSTYSLFSAGSDAAIYDFNATYDMRDSGRYKMTSPSSFAAERRSWATVFEVGTYKGERWFGWYFCSGMLDITEKGYAAIYKEGSSADATFLAKARDVLKDAGLLRYGDFYRVRQQKCDDAF